MALDHCFSIIKIDKLLQLCDKAEKVKTEILYEGIWGSESGLFIEMAQERKRRFIELAKEFDYPVFEWKVTFTDVLTHSFDTIIAEKSI